MVGGEEMSLYPGVVTGGESMAEADGEGVAEILGFES